MEDLSSSGKKEDIDVLKTYANWVTLLKCPNLVYQGKLDISEPADFQ